MEKLNYLVVEASTAEELEKKINNRSQFGYVPVSDVTAYAKDPNTTHYVVLMELIND
jgi:hypothetical protein